MPDYGTVAGFRIYHTARGRDVSTWDDDDATIEAAKLVASEKLDGMQAWPGFKTGGRDQVREWPRTDVQDREDYTVPYETVPTEVENATYELTLKELQSPGSLTVDYTSSKYTRVSIDGAVSVQYADRSAYEMQTQYPIVMQILAPLIGGKITSGLSGVALRT